jgi:hypothetical protein
MASGAGNVFRGSFVGAAGQVDIEKLPFKPAAMMFWRTNGGHIEHGYKTEDMSGDTYLSTSTGADAGVTFNSDGTVTVANGADINAAGITTYYEAHE